MRSALPLLLLAACGAPAFVPVTFTMTDDWARLDVVAFAEKKLNPSCAMNCELATAIEDGGCDGLSLFRDGGLSCPPGGGVYMPFYGVANPYLGPNDAGTHASPARNIAPGTELTVSDFSANDGYPECAGKFTINGPTEIIVTRTASSCTVTTN